METFPAEDHQPQTESNKSGISKPQELIQKLKLEKSIPHSERALKVYEVLSEWYKLTEEFLNDEVNQSLLLGACQKLAESTDPLYKKRIKKFIKTLVAPSMGKERFDSNEIFGQGGSRGSLDKEAQTKYLEEVTDEEATKEFIEKYQDLILNAKAEWAKKGYDLEIDIKIVSDTTLNFKSKTGGTGFINVPDSEGLSQKTEKPKVTFVLLKGVTDKDEFINHELYHVKDYFDFIRRGNAGAVLEGLDELHTEYASENYRKDKNNNSGYVVLKNFWQNLSFMGDLDFDLLADRKNTIKEISENFGVDGATTFGLQSAQGGGSFSSFEVFYNNPNRTIIEMLVSKGKVNLYKALERGELAEKIKLLPEILEKLKKLSIPRESRTATQYRSIYDFVASEGEKKYSANFDEINSEDSKEMVLAYTQALAFAELFHQKKEIPELKESYNQIIEALSLLPHQIASNTRNLSPQDYISSIVERDKPYYKTEEEMYKKIYSKLFYTLSKEQEGTDFAFSLENPITKNQILDPFLRQLDGFAKDCLKRNNPELVKSFIQGFFGYIVSSELRDSSLEYLKANNPELVSIIDETLYKTDTGKLKAVSI